MKSIRIIILLVVLAVVVLGLVLMKREMKKEKTLEIPEPQEEKQVDWQTHLPRIQQIIDSENIDSLARPAQIVKEINLTDDGIPEVIVDVGAGGAYTALFEIYMIENGVPVHVKTRMSDNTIGYAGFNVGASACNQVDYKVFPADQTFYTVEEGHCEDSEPDIDYCRLAAYKWNAGTKLFEYDRDLSGSMAQSRGECGSVYTSF